MDFLNLDKLIPTRFPDFLLQVDEVEEYIPSGDYKDHKRILLFNGRERLIACFYFAQDEDMRLVKSFIKTSDKYMKLLEFEMMLIQDEVNLEEFIRSINP